MSIFAKRGIIRVRLWLMLFAFIILIALPFVIPKFWTQIVIEIFIMALFASSLNLLLGYTGMLSFGQGAFYGVGAYTLTLLVLKLSAPLTMAFLAGAIMSAIFGAVIGFFCVRLRGFYFAILTLGFGQLVWAFIWKLRNFTGGDDGLVGLTLPSLINTPVRYYFFTLIITSICIAALWKIVNSPFGVSLQSIRENPDRTEFIGINVTNYRLIAFVLAALFSGIAGMLFALFNGGAFPEFVHWMKSGDPIMATILGGIGTFLGPLVGAALMILLDQIIGSITQYWPFFLGIILLFLVLFLPGGVLGSIIPRVEALIKVMEKAHDSRD